MGIRHRRRHPAGEWTEFTAAWEPEEDPGATRPELLSEETRRLYDRYVGHVLQERDRALGQIARIHRAARRFITLGYALVGFAVLAFVGGIILQVLRGGTIDVRDLESFEQASQLVVVGGVPWFVVALVVFVLGILVALIGGLIQVTATNEEDRLDRDYPLPPGLG
jgi:hypothetical protein